MPKTTECYICGIEFHECEGSSFREDSKQEEPTGVICADCASNY